MGEDVEGLTARGRSSQDREQGATDLALAGNSPALQLPLHGFCLELRYDQRQYGHCRPVLAHQTSSVPCTHGIKITTHDSRSHDIVLHQATLHWLFHRCLCVVSFLGWQAVQAGCYAAHKHITLATHLLHWLRSCSLRMVLCHWMLIRLAVSPALHYITLHYITLHYITLRYVTLVDPYLPFLGWQCAMQPE